MYIAGDNEEMSSRKAISGALALYLDFLNLFIQELISINRFYINSCWSIYG